VKLGSGGPTVLVQLRGGLQTPNRTVTQVGSTTIRMTGGAACIDNAPTPHRWLCLGPFTAITGKRPSRGLYSRHTMSHYIDEPPDIGLYIQQDNILFYQ
jgi:hypothetical protein